MTRRATCGLAALVAILTSSFVETQAPPDSRQAAQRVVTRIQRADYEGDRAGLARLRAELRPFRDHRELAATVRYWQGFAAWRRALNGFNESADPNELDQDLRTAVRDFEAALRARPGYVDANAGLISCLQNLTFLHRTDQAAVQQLVPRFVTLLRESLAAAPDNPRLLWVYGASQWYTPSGPAPEDIDKRQASALATYQRGLALARAAQGRTLDPLEPAWGEPELLMNLAWANLNRRIPDARSAEAYAKRALALVPYWHYVRDILMTQIQKASDQSPDKQATAAAAVTSVALRVHREDAMAAFYAEGLAYSRTSFGAGSDDESVDGFAVSGVVWRAVHARATVRRVRRGRLGVRASFDAGSVELDREAS
jgi:tetratricopeptide (TPR) repeat protein